MKSLLFLPFLTVVIFGCGGPAGVEVSAEPTPYPRAAALFGRESQPFEIEFTPSGSISELVTGKVYWREAHGARRLDVLNIAADGTPSGTFVIEFTNSSSGTGQRCLWSYASDAKLWSRCDAYSSGLTTYQVIDLFVSLRRSGVTGTEGQEEFSGHLADCYSTTYVVRLSKQDGRLCLGVAPNIPLYFGAANREFEFVASTITVPYTAGEFLPSVALGSSELAGIDALLLPKSAQEAIVTSARQ